MQEYYGTEVGTLKGSRLYVGSDPKLTIFKNTMAEMPINSNIIKMGIGEHSRRQ